MRDSTVDTSRKRKGAMPTPVSKSRGSENRGGLIMRKLTYFGLAFALLTGLPCIQGHGEEGDDLHKLMERKLKYSQQVLEGLAVNNLDKVARAGEELIAISQAAE